MSRRPLIVLADDLTGAAEVAAIAHEDGLRAVVLTKPPRVPVDADVLVIDTDTRLVKPAVAARRIRAATAKLKKLPHGGFFKKTDSVLRGPVLAELTACAQALDRQRVLLVAANPSLGRTIHDGRLLVEGRPIDQTPFARDPHHPARSAGVIALLGAEGKPDVMSASPGKTLPLSGVIVGDHRSAADTAKWARAADHTTLPAGGADFFRAWLRMSRMAGGAFLSAETPAKEEGADTKHRTPKSRRTKPLSPTELPLEPALLLHGTTAASANVRVLRFNGLRAPAAVRVAAALRQRRAVAVAATAPTLVDPLAPPIVARNFAALTCALRDSHAFRHLLIVGGATAASVLHALGWSRLEVVRLWGPGVVSLRPAAAPGFTVTLKPGSYLWPDSIRQALPAVFS